MKVLQEGTAQPLGLGFGCDCGCMSGVGCPSINVGCENCVATS